MVLYPRYGANTDYHIYRRWLCLARRGVDTGRGRSDIDGSLTVRGYDLDPARVVLLDQREDVPLLKGRCGPIAGVVIDRPKHRHRGLVARPKMRKRVAMTVH